VGADSYRSSWANTGACDCTGSCGYCSRRSADKECHITRKECHITRKERRITRKEGSEVKWCRSEHFWSVVAVRNTGLFEMIVGF